MSNAGQWVKEQSMQIFSNACQSAKRELSAIEQEKMEQITRTQMALGTLERWPELSEKDMQGLACQEIARQALSLIDHPEAKAMALEDLARECLARDKPAGVMLATRHGLDLSKHPKAACGGDKKTSGRALGAQPSHWLGLALERGAWKSLAWLAGEAKAREACPGFDEQGHEVELGQSLRETIPATLGRDEKRHEKPTKKSGNEALDLNHEQENKKIQDRWDISQKIAWAVELTNDYPLLALWRMDPQPNQALAALEALARGPISARFGEKNFDFAATLLALRGSSMALRECEKAGIHPGAAISDLRTHQGGDKPGAWWSLELAQRGGNEIQWQSVGAWLDKTMGVGACKEMEAAAAFHALDAQGGWPRSKDQEHRRREIDWALNRLEQLAADGPRAAEQVAALQSLAIEAREVEAGVESPSYLREKLEATLIRWGQAKVLGIRQRKPRRV